MASQAGLVGNRTTIERRLALGKAICTYATCRASFWALSLSSVYCLIGSLYVIKCLHCFTEMSRRNAVLMLWRTWAFTTTSVSSLWDGSALVSMIADLLSQSDSSSSGRSMMFIMSSLPIFKVHQYSLLGCLNTCYLTWCPWPRWLGLGCFEQSSDATMETKYAHKH